MTRRASACWLGAAAQALLLLTTLGGCSEDTAYVHVTFKQLPAGASRLLLSVKLGSTAASQLDPLQLPAEPLTEATLGVRLPRSPQVERLLVLSAGVLDAGKCLLASGVGEQVFAGTPTDMDVDLSPAPKSPSGPCDPINPLLFGVTPARTSTAGGDTVAFHGWNFSNPASVTLAGKPVPNLRWNSSFELVGDSPMLSGTSHEQMLHTPVKVTNADNRSVSSDRVFSLSASSLQLSELSATPLPESGPALLAVGKLQANSPSPGLVVAFPSSGSAYFTPAVAVAQPPLTRFTLEARTSALALSDLKQRGLSDLVSANLGDGNIAVRQNKSAALPFDTVSSRNSVGLAPGALQVLPIDRGGFPSLVVADLLFDEVSVLPSSGTGVFDRTNRARYAVLREPTILLSGDLNGDGLPELVVGQRSGVALQILRNAGNGKFPKLDPINLPAGSSASMQNSGSPRLYNAMALADLNGDGFLDLVLLNTDSTPPRVRVLLNTQNGLFATDAARSSEYLSDQGLLAMTTMDLDQDGKTDIVLGLSGGGVRVLKQPASGPLTAHRVDLPNPKARLSSLLATDVDSDGFPDLIGVDSTSQVGSSTLYVLKNSSN